MVRKLAACCVLLSPLWAILVIATALGDGLAALAGIGIAIGAIALTAGSLLGAKYLWESSK